MGQSKPVERGHDLKSPGCQRAELARDLAILIRRLLRRSANPQSTDSSVSASGSSEVEHREPSGRPGPAPCA